MTMPVPADPGTEGAKTGAYVTVTGADAGRTGVGVAGIGVGVDGVSVSCNGGEDESAGGAGSEVWTGAGACAGEATASTNGTEDATGIRAAEGSGVSITGCLTGAADLHGSPHPHSHRDRRRRVVKRKMFFFISGMLPYSQVSLSWWNIEILFQYSGKGRIRQGDSCGIALDSYGILPYVNRLMSGIFHLGKMPYPLQGENWLKPEKEGQKSPLFQLHSKAVWLFLRNFGTKMLLFNIWLPQLFRIT